MEGGGEGGSGRGRDTAKCVSLPAACIIDNIQKIHGENCISNQLK